MSARMRRLGGLYLPLQWLDEVGLTAVNFLADPQADPRIRTLTARLLTEAAHLYTRAEAGVPALPLGCRPGIFAARHVYAGIGTAVARNGHDSITRRARTSASQKLGWLALSVLRSGLSVVAPGPATLHAAPAREVAFLVDAAARQTPRFGRSDALLSVFATLEAQDRTRKGLDRARA